MNLKLLSQEVPGSISELIKVLLDNRGITQNGEFLQPPSPLKLTLSDVGIDAREMKKAVARLLLAKKRDEKIIVFGDYDCDGVCATAVLWETLHENGYKVLPFIPNRETHGYGLSLKAVEEILASGTPAILISVDNGIVARAAWDRLGEVGVFRILTDHHESDGLLPNVEALIHTTKLCGTTVSWMLARQVDKTKAEKLLDLCAMATIADQVPLTVANRAFASHGLKQLNHTARLGLKLLIETAGLTGTEINSFAVNFGIVPRINAMGRLGHAMDALRALCTTNSERAKVLVEKLSSTNIDRQELTKELVELARSRAKEWESQRVIVIEDTSFHEGVIGLIAGKLMEEFHKPTIVIAVGEMTSKASARSIPGVHITKMLREVSEVLLDVGGHPLAAGFRIETTRIAEFKQKLGERALVRVTDELLEPFIQPDCELRPELVTLESAEAIKALEPYGQANPEPLFYIKDVVLERIRQVGKEGRHLSFLANLGNHSVSGVAFNQGDKVGVLEPDAKISLVATLDINQWKGKRSVQLKTKQIRVDTLP